MNAELGERVLVVGATGFLGPVLVDELCRAGFHVVCGVRNLQKAAVELDLPGVEFLQVNLNDDLEPAVWRTRLQEYKIDRVVNNVGIATRFGRQSIENVNVKAPLALFEAMRQLVQEGKFLKAEKNIPRVIQISTTGVDWPDCDSFPYPASKSKVDKALSRMPGLAHVIVRPNVIYEPERGHLLLEEIAKIPINFYIGKAKIQPIHSREIAIGVSRLLQKEIVPGKSILRAVGPVPMNWQEVFECASQALGRQYFCMCSVPLVLAQGVTLLIQTLPTKLLRHLGILSKMTPQTIVMMTKGSTGSNKEWLQATGLRAIDLGSCYQAYAGGTEVYTKFIEAIRVDG